MAFCFLLNQLLGRERWARDRLVPFAGQAVEFRPPLLPPLRLRIAADARIEPAEDEPVGATIGLDGVSGATPLAGEVRYLARHLRWDAEEELSRLVGDVAAQRIGDTVRALARWQRDATLRIGEALADYAGEGRGTLVGRTQLARFAADVEHLSRALAELDERIARLD